MVVVQFCQEMSTTGWQWQLLKAPITAEECLVSAWNGT